MKRCTLKMTTDNKIKLEDCKDPARLQEDLVKAASLVEMGNVSFKVADGNGSVEIVGWPKVSFLDSACEDEDKKLRLKKWMKWWSHLSKMGYNID